MIKYIVFDWSGVINDSVENHLLVTNRMFKIFGGPAISLLDLKENWEQPYMHFWNKYFPDLTLAEEQVAYREAIAESPPGRPYPGIVDLVQEFKTAGIKMAVVSSDFPETILPEIENFGLADVFIDVMFDVHDKTEGVREIMARNNFKTEETIFIGDSNHEIEAGKSVGMQTGAVTWGFCTEARLQALNPDFMIHNLAEFKSVIFSS